MEERKCWICHRTHQDLKDIEDEWEPLEKDDQFLIVNTYGKKGNYNNALLKKKIFLCHICNSLIQIIIEKDLTENFEVNFDTQFNLEGGKIELQ